MLETKIPMLDLSGEIDALWEPLHEAVTGVLRSGQFILGQEVSAFEEEAAAYLGVKHAIGCNSGTDALILALRAIDIGPDDEVIVPSFSFFATAEPVSLVGATPVFVDIEPESFNLDPALLEAAITPKTKAIIPVHLFGQAVDMNAIVTIAKAHNLRIIEDTAQAFGGRYIESDGDSARDGDKQTMLGTIGDLGAYSFFPTKNLGAYGDAGLVTTNDNDIAHQLRMLRVHGSEKRYHNDLIGYNSRLDAMQATILRVKLPYLDAWNDRRRAAAARYDALLAGLDDIITPPQVSHAHHVFHQYTVRVKGGRRDALMQQMADRGVSSMVYYPIPIHQQKPYLAMNVELPLTEQAAAEVLSLPMWSTIDEATQEAVIAAMKN